MINKKVTDKSYETTLKILDMLENSEYKNIVYKGAVKCRLKAKNQNR